MEKRRLDSFHLSEPRFLPVSSASFLVALEEWGVNLALFLVPSIAQLRRVFDSLEAFSSPLWSELPWCSVCRARLCLRIRGPPCCVRLPQGSLPHEDRPHAQPDFPTHATADWTWRLLALPYAYCREAADTSHNLCLSYNNTAEATQEGLGGLNRDLKLACN